MVSHAELISTRKEQKTEMVELKRDLNIKLAKQRREIGDMINKADKKGMTQPGLQFMTKRRKQPTSTNKLISKSFTGGEGNTFISQ